MKEHLSPSAFCQLHLHCQDAYINGVRETTAAMLIGGHVDAYFSKTLHEFVNKDNNYKLIYTTKNELRADFQMAENIIKVIEADPMLLSYVSSGSLQHKVEGKIADVPFLGYIDNLIKGKAIVDLKVVKSIKQLIWNDKFRCKESFIDAYGYIYQLAIYQELHFQMTGEKLPCFIAAVSKEKGHDKEVIYLPQEKLDEAIEEVKQYSKHYLNIRMGKVEPERCGTCEHCFKTKILKDTLHYDNLINL